MHNMLAPNMYRLGWIPQADLAIPTAAPTRTSDCLISRRVSQPRLKRRLWLSTASYPTQSEPHNDLSLYHSASSSFLNFFRPSTAFSGLL